MGRFHVSPRLYDCFIPPARSPPISGKAPNGTGLGSCQGYENKGHCYEKSYQSYRVCLGFKAGAIEGRKYETLEAHLQGREPLSTYLKIDTEGSEWNVLDRFLDNEA